MKINYIYDYDLVKDDFDIGYDIKAKNDFYILPGETERIETSLRLELPKGVYVDVRGRSGLAIHGIFCILGLVDSGYRGEVSAIMHNSSKEAYWIFKGQRIAQIVFNNVDDLELVKVKKIDSFTKRGENGFGSSGKF
ncbi:MAG: deoxyuridine 5'-triphosphate nucleotidohydrolase [Peptoniphilaceae bacterium]|nr:deoxyuridine 5'-triphosphate nucleotidohydrolase [Peptoniphilaceae bacterium]